MKWEDEKTYGWEHSEGLVDDTRLRLTGQVGPSVDRKKEDTHAEHCVNEFISSYVY